MNPALRAIPSVEKTIKALEPLELPRRIVLGIIRTRFERMREGGEIPEFTELCAGLKAEIDGMARGRIQPVINGTGIVLHTNLGRAPLPRKALEQVVAIAEGYSTLEYDLASGERGSRGAYVEKGLAALCEAEAAVAVNNCAAALLLILKQFTREKKEVIISRGELVQIGGGFRIPEILEASGAVLREAGTTNKTNLEDYKKLIGANTAIILKVHQSNFWMDGFVESTGLKGLSDLSKQHGIPLVFDLGSGAVIDSAEVNGLPGEPTPAGALREGADIVCFSGDKLFGGPQAGIIAGKSSHIEALKRNPVFRALRCDKMTLAALQGVVELYLDGEDSIGQIPAWKALSMPVEELRKRGDEIIRNLGSCGKRVQLEPSKSEAGGGTLPAARVDSICLAINAAQTELDPMAAAFRGGKPPVIGFIREGKFQIDLRTVFPEQDTTLARIISEILTRF